MHYLVYHFRHSPPPRPIGQHQDRIGLRNFLSVGSQFQPCQCSVTQHVNKHRTSNSLTFLLQAVLHSCYLFFSSAAPTLSTALTANQEYTLFPIQIGQDFLKWFLF